MSDADSPPAAGVDNTPVAKVALPPLRLHHLMLLTTVMAVLMTTFREYSRDGETLTVATSTTSSFAQAVSLTVVLCGCVWRRHGLRFPSQPGHGLAILGVLNVLITSSHIAFQSTFQLSPEEYWYRPDALALIYGPTIAITLLAVVLSLRLGSAVADNGTWRWIYRLTAINAALCATMFIFYFLASVTQSYSWYGFARVCEVCFFISSTASYLLFALGIAIDVRRGAVRHWSHWLEVGASVLSGVGWIATYALYFSREF